MVLNPVKIKSTDVSGTWGVRASLERKAREDLSEEVKPKGSGSAQNGHSQCARHSEQWMQTFQGRYTVGKLEGQKARVGWEWGRSQDGGRTRGQDMWGLVTRATGELRAGRDTT